MEGPHLTFLSGGTGTPKLLRGFRELDYNTFEVVVNTGEDNRILGLYVSPDVDTVVYTLAGIVNEETWYGIENDTFRGHGFFEELGVDEPLRIGDADRALKQYRTYLIEEESLTLSEATDSIRRALGVKWSVHPMTDDTVTTIVVTDEGRMHFHEFWVERRGEPAVKDVVYEGADEASPSPGALRAVSNADVIVIGPSNPVTSVGPILSLSELRRAMVEKPLVVVSPFVGKGAVSGPADKLIRAVGFEPDVHGLIQYYREWGLDPDVLIMDERDPSEEPDVPTVVKTNTIMKDVKDSVALARRVVKAADETLR